MADNSLSTTVEQRKARRRRSVHRYFTCTLLTLAADAAVNSYSLFATHWVTTCAPTLWPMPPFSYDWWKPPPYLTSVAEGTGQGERDESPSSLPSLPTLVPGDQHSLQLPAVASLTKEAQGVWERGVWQAGLSVLRGRKGSQESQRGETRENVFTGLREMREEMPELQSYRYVIGNSVLDLAIASYIRLVFLSLFAVRLLCASSLSDEGKEASHLVLPIFLQVLSLLLATVKAIARSEGSVFFSTLSISSPALCSVLHSYRSCRFSLPTSACSLMRTQSSVTLLLSLPPLCQSTLWPRLRGQRTLMTYDYSEVAYRLDIY